MREIKPKVRLRHEFKNLDEKISMAPLGIYVFLGFRWTELNQLCFRSNSLPQAVASD